MLLPLPLPSSFCPPLSLQVVDELRQGQSTAQVKYKKAAQKVAQGEQALERLGMELQHSRNEVGPADIIRTMLRHHWGLVAKILTICLHPLITPHESPGILTIRPPSPHEPQLQAKEVSLAELMATSEVLQHANAQMQSQVSAMICAPAGRQSWLSQWQYERGRYERTRPRYKLSGCFTALSLPLSVPFPSHPHPALSVPFPSHPHPALSGPSRHILIPPSLALPVTSSSPLSHCVPSPSPPDGRRQPRP